MVFPYLCKVVRGRCSYDFAVYVYVFNQISAFGRNGVQNPCPRRHCGFSFRRDCPVGGSRRRDGIRFRLFLLEYRRKAHISRKILHDIFLFCADGLSVFRPTGKPIIAHRHCLDPDIASLLVRSLPGQRSCICRGTGEGKAEFVLGKHGGKASGIRDMV